MTLLNLCRPTSLAELVAVMRGADPVHLIAGGTDLLVGSRALPDAGRLVDLTALPALRGIDTTGPDIRIGAATTVAEIGPTAPRPTPARLRCILPKSRLIP